MVEAIVILIFLALLLFLQLKEGNKILIKSASNKRKKIIGTTIGILLLLIVKPQQASEYLILVIFSILVIAINYFPQGLGENELVLFGLVDFDYNKFNKIEIVESIKKSNDVKVAFLHKNNRTVKCLQFSGNSALEIKAFLAKRLTDKAEIKIMSK